MHTHFYGTYTYRRQYRQKDTITKKQTLQLLHLYKFSKQTGSSRWDRNCLSYNQRSPIDKIFEYFQTLQKWVWEICSSMFLWKGHFWAKWFSVYLAVAERKNISNVYFLSLEDDEDKLCWSTKHEIIIQDFFESNNMFISPFAGANRQLTLKYLPWKLLCIFLHFQIFLMSDPQKHRPQVGQVYHISWYFNWSLYWSFTKCFSLLFFRCVQGVQGVSPLKHIWQTLYWFLGLVDF